MGNNTYNRYKLENKELKERLALLENGVTVGITDRVVKIPESFKRLHKEMWKEDSQWGIGCTLSEI